MNQKPDYTAAKKEDFENPEHYKRYLKNLKNWRKTAKIVNDFKKFDLNIENEI